MKAALDRQQFGPWALITGASSGIGKEFARQIARAGINVVLVARRESLLDDFARSLSQNPAVKCRVIPMDLSQAGFIDRLAERTNDLDIGMVVSNAGTGNPGEFLKLDPQLLEATLQLEVDPIVWTKFRRFLGGAASCPGGGPKAAIHSGLESALGSHPCVALSSYQAPPLYGSRA